MTESAAVVLYEERDGVAFVTLNRPEKKNTLTEAVIAGIADGIDRATAFGDQGFREVIRDRDRPWGDYGERAR
jgi:enoyl-CoA hydratase/carnithine racemase